MNLSSLLTPRPAPQTRNPAAPRPGFADRLSTEFGRLVERAPPSVRPIANRLTKSPVLLALAVGAGLFLITNKRTRAGAAALAAAALATRGSGQRRGYGR